MGWTWRSAIGSSCRCWGLRAAAAGGAGAGDRARAACIPARRAALEPGRAAQGDDAHGAEAAALRAGADVRVRDARPGRGADHVGPDRGDAGWGAAAVGAAG